MKLKSKDTRTQQSQIDKRIHHRLEESIPILKNETKLMKPTNKKETADSKADEKIHQYRGDEFR